MISRNSTIVVVTTAISALLGVVYVSPLVAQFLERQLIEVRRHLDGADFVSASASVSRLIDDVLLVISAECDRLGHEGANIDGFLITARSLQSARDCIADEILQARRDLAA